MASFCRAVFLAGAMLPFGVAAGQTSPETLRPDVERKSPVRAAALSLVLPGMGQRYVSGGRWKGSATVFALADIAAWVGLVRTIGARDQRVDSYRALAASRAEADVAGKDRTFFLNLATFRSSDEYLDTQLRNRAWDQLDYVDSREFQWDWATDADFLRFRDLRNDAESLDRRASILVAMLVANRIVSAVAAVRSANRSNNRTNRTMLSFSPPSAVSKLPHIHVRVRI